MADWSLAIDFGTTFTAAATAAGGASPEPLEIDGSRSLPSVVCLDDDRQILTGRTAASQAAVFPERAERLPKRALAAADTVRLDGQDVPTVQLVAAVLGRVAREATRRFNGEPPTTVVLTHPAGWGQPEITRLGQAAAHAGLPAPRFLPEPVAAAIYYTAATTETGVPLDGHAAVYDLGGGTFDTAVLRRTADGYDVRGTGGDPHFGGEDIDTLLLDLVAGHLPADARDTWDDLWGGDARRARRAQTKIREEIVKAKHELSERPTHTVYLDEYLDGVDDGIRLTRAELDEALTKPLAGTTTELLRTIRAADLDPAALTAVYLTGGATRTPRITDAVTAALGTLPTTSGDPKLVVALGALTTPPQAPRSATPAAGTGSGSRIQRPQIAAAPWTARLGVLTDDEVRHRGWCPAHVVDGDVIYAQSSAGLFAFDARSGELLWENPEAAGAPCGLLFVAGDLLVSAFGPRHDFAPSTSEIWVGNKHSGANVWHNTVQGRQEYHGLAVDESRVFVASGQLSAFTLASGELLWSVHRGDHSLLRAGDLLYAVREIPGRVSALSPDTGREVWTTPTKDQFWCVPATDGSRLFVGAGKSALALDLNWGGILWTTKDNWKQAGTIGVGTDGHIYTGHLNGGVIRQRQAHDGTAVNTFTWPARALGQNRTAAHATESYLYATSTEGLLAFHLGRSGSPAWQREDLNVSASTVAVAHGLVYVTADGYLHALDAATGNGPRK
jgi:outer membrane protein assembly factor BamB/actin-like ATPase involved in cell morphogenesis